MARQTLFQVDLVDGDFKNELARARTFGFLHEVERLRAAGFARGASLDNAVVVDRRRVLNRTASLHERDSSRHKALDAIGDLYLAGAPLIGAFEGRRSGHKLYHRLLAELFADETAWSYVAPAQPAPVVAAAGDDAALDSRRLSA